MYTDEEYESLAHLIEGALSLDGIEAWARAKKPEEIVGVRGHPCGCPIYRYLLQTVQVPKNIDLSVNPLHVAAWADEPIFDVDLPAPLMALVNSIDCGSQPGNRSVTAGMLIRTIRRGQER